MQLLIYAFLTRPDEPEARPLEPPGHRSPLNYYVPGVCVTGVDVTLPTTWTGREPKARALPG